MRTLHAAVAGLTLVAVIAVSGCTSPNDNGQPPAKTTAASPSTSTRTTTPVSPSPQGHPDMVGITIKNFAYTGAPSVTPGQMILVTNDDSTAHTLTSDTAGLFNVTVEPNGGTAMFDAPRKPGSYPYHCSYHSSMHGALVVK